MEVVRPNLRSHKRNRGTKHQSITQPLADPLRQKQLPIRARAARREDPQNLQCEPYSNREPEISRIKRTPRECTDEVNEQDLHGSNPADGRRLNLKSIRIVGLKEPERGDIAPAIDDDEVSSEGLGPCFPSTVWSWWRRDGGCVGDCWI